jgi:nitrite reductase/ring-hydroxylating ferredoxin subunit
MAIVSQELTDNEVPVGSTIETGTRRRQPVKVPSYRYISPDFAARELRDLWPRVWQLAGTVDQAPNPGDFFEYRVEPYSVLIVRGADGNLRAFQNVCRHRGNELCVGSGTGLSEIRCPYHRWSWDLAGRLREVPSRRGFGVLRNDDYPLISVRLDTWGPLVFVNLSPDAEPLDEFLEGVPADCEWAGLDDFRCTYVVSIEAKCNWKTLIEAFSETYHVQGIHREMLPMCDDVNSPQRLWSRHGKLQQPYGLPSSRYRDRPDDATVWEAFIEVMGARIGIPDKASAGPVPPVPSGQSLRNVLAERVRDTGRAKGLDFSPFSDDQVMSMQQYNLFPNITVLVFPDLLSVIRARPGASADEAVMDAFAFERVPPGHPAPRRQPIEVTVPADSDPPLGLVLSQDVANFARTQRGLHQPGFTHLTLSGEECRIVNLHRNLERYLGISPSELINDVD